MFLHITVIVFTGEGGHCPGGSLSGGGSLLGGLCSGGLCWGEGLCPGGSLSRGISVMETLPYGERADGTTAFYCILVSQKFRFAFNQNLFTTR